MTESYGVLTFAEALMQLYGADYQQLMTALIDGFDYGQLATLLRVVGHRLDRIASAQVRLDDVVRAVIESAENGNWIDTLASSAKQMNQTNRKLQALPNWFIDDSVPFPEPAIPYRRIAGNRIVSLVDGKEMTLIPDGDFFYGEDRHLLHFPAFWIDATPVTNAEYKRFIDANEKQRPPFNKAEWAQAYNWDSRLRTFPPGKARHPVVLVGIVNVLAYSQWSGKTIMSEEQWEKAAGAPDDREYPWGEWEEQRCNMQTTGIGQTSPVGRYAPAGSSYYGSSDMGGNVWEWTRSHYYPTNQQTYVVRGGAWDSAENEVKITFRDYHYPLFWSYNNIGFRLIAPVAAADETAHAPSDTD